MPLISLSLAISLKKTIFEGSVSFISSGFQRSQKKTSILLSKQVEIYVQVLIRNAACPIIWNHIPNHAPIRFDNS